MGITDLRFTIYDLRFCRFFSLVALYILLCASSKAQLSPSRYFIQFTDKNNSPYSLSTPSAFLSARAIARRSAHGISYSTADLPVNPQYADSVASLGATILNRSKWLNGVTVYIGDSATLLSIQSLPFVHSSHAVQLRKAINNSVKKDPVVQPSGMLRTTADDTLNYGLSFFQLDMIHLDSLHAEGYTGEGMLIAMLDDGFNKVDSIPAFDSLRNDGRILAVHDFVDGDEDVYRDTIYGENNISHGMYTLSTIAANVPGSIIGSAPHASFLLLRTEQAASEFLIEEYNWAAAAEYADSAGADIISTSLSYTTFDDSTEDHTYSDMDGKTCPITIAAEIAASRGILVVGSAGNDGNFPWQYIGAPVDGDSVLTVGAVDPFGAAAGFTSKGPTADGRLKPNVAAQGAPALVATEGGTTFLSGTSFSCPIIAGAAACLWQKYPAVSNMELFHAIEQSANHYASPDTITGYGIPDFYSANLLLAGFNIRTPAIKVFPNPATDFITVALNHKVNGVMQITDMLGKTVMERNLSSNETIFSADVNILAKSVYILQIISNEGTLITRLIKQ